jgi:hypothetical protein
MESSSKKDGLLLGSPPRPSASADLPQANGERERASQSFHVGSRDAFGFAVCFSLPIKLAPLFPLGAVLSIASHTSWTSRPFRCRLNEFKF